MTAFDSIKNVKSFLANESLIINEDGEFVDAKKSRAAEKAAKARELHKELGLHEKYEQENDLKGQEANENASMSCMIGGAQTAAPLKAIPVTTIEQIKEFINGKSA